MRMYCPNCKEYTECKVVTHELMVTEGIGDVYYDEVKDTARVENVDEYKGYRTFIGGINCYARCRWCEECLSTFWTVELDQNSFQESINEIVKLQEEVDTLRPTAQEFTNLSSCIEKINQKHTI